MNKKQLIVVWLLAAWLAFSFLYAARHVEEPGVWALILTLGRKK